MVNAFCGRKDNGRLQTHFSEVLTQFEQVGLPSSHFFFLRLQLMHPVRERLPAELAVLSRGITTYQAVL